MFILFFWLTRNYPIHVPDDRYRPNDLNGGIKNAAPALGSLFILPVLMFGGWIAIAVIGGILGLIGSIIGGFFSGLSSLASAAFSGSGLVIGIVIGLVAFYHFRNRNARNTVEVEEE